MIESFAKSPVHIAYCDVCKAKLVTTGYTDTKEDGFVFCGYCASLSIGERILSARKLKGRRTQYDNTLDTKWQILKHLVSKYLTIGGNENVKR